MSEYQERQKIEDNGCMEHCGPAALAWLEMFPANSAYAGLLARKYDKDGDFAHPGTILDAFLSGQVEASCFNCCALPYPLAVAKKAATLINNKERGGNFSERDRQALLLKGRKLAASSVNLPDERGVAFCRNATEAASLFKWLANLKLKRVDLDTAFALAGSVLTTDIEGPSIQREIELIRDPGNPFRHDSISSFQNFGSSPKYPAPLHAASRLATTVVPVHAHSDAKVLQNLALILEANLFDVVILSHVDRHTGRILPIEQMIALIREAHAVRHPEGKQPFIMIDGAQAYGNLPKIDFLSLGCDAYVASPHKTLRSEVVGLLFFHPSNPRVQAGIARLANLSYQFQIILHDMFDPRLGINPNVKDSIAAADLAGFVAAMEYHNARWVNGNDFSKMNEARGALKKHFQSRLKVVQARSGFKIWVPNLDVESNFISSFRISNMGERRTVADRYWGSRREAPGHSIAENLAIEGFFLGYLQGAEVIRVGIDPDLTIKAVDELIEALIKVLNRSEYDQLRSESADLFPGVPRYERGFKPLD